MVNTHKNNRFRELNPDDYFSDEEGSTHNAFVNAANVTANATRNNNQQRNSPSREREHRSEPQQHRSEPQNHQNEDEASSHSNGVHHTTVIQNNDNPGLILSTIQLTSDNYMTWSRSLLRALKVKEMAEFVHPDAEEPPEGIISNKRWSKKDCLVTQWILNTISKEIGEGFQYVTSSKELWQDLAHRFGQSNTPQLFKLKREINLLTQGNMSILIYFNKLKKLWDELMFLRPQPTCICEAAKHCACNVFQRRNEMSEEDKLIQFLMGLNEQYDAIKNQISIMEPLPDLNKAYSMLTKVENQNSMSADHSLEISNFPKASNTNSKNFLNRFQKWKR